MQEVQHSTDNTFFAFVLDWQSPVVCPGGQAGSVSLPGGEGERICLVMQEAKPGIDRRMEVAG